jgi:hypothetical protein
MNRIQITKIIIIFLLSCAGMANAQSYHCGTDSLYLKLKKINPQIELNEKIQNQLIYEKTVESMNHPSYHSQSILTVPIVFHIMHENGPEDVPDSIITQAVNQLNLRYQNASPYNDTAGTDIGIQFCLASVDTNGNATTGITRDTSFLTNINFNDYTHDTMMKNKNHWQDYLYLNVWVVRSISNGAYTGYAYYPSSIGQPEDGVVIAYNALNSYVLSHEVGHYFGLYHTFTGGCPNYNCLLDGDFVCDTPPDSTHNFEPCPGNSCSTDMNDTSGHNPFNTDMNDSPNYMDYTSCPLLFTNGQSQRMNLSLTSIRNLLLVSNGCGQNSTIGPPIAGFKYSIDTCYTGVVQFTDTSHNYPVEIKWDFLNNGVYEASGTHPSYTFTTGHHTIKEVVQGIVGKDSCYRTIFVQYNADVIYPIGSYANINTDSAGNLIACQGIEVELSSVAGVSYLWSNGATTENMNFIADTSCSIWVTMVDDSGLTWHSNQCHQFAITVVPGVANSQVWTPDSTTICQNDSVILHLTLDSSIYHYQWYEEYFSAISGATDTVFAAHPSFFNDQYYAIITASDGCTSMSNIISLNGIPLPAQQGITLNGNILSTIWGGGKQWFLNNVPIPGATGMSDTVTQTGCYTCGFYFSPHIDCMTMSDTTFCFYFTDIEALSNTSNSITLYPDPVKDILNIKMNTATINTTLTIVDILGQTVYKTVLNTDFISIPVNTFPAGIYSISLKNDSGCFNRKWVKE